MKLSTIQKLCCPFDKSALHLTKISEDIEGQILEGYLHCMDCQRIYPIVSGIPIMSPDEYREISIEQPLIASWQSHMGNQKFSQFRLTAPVAKEDNG